MPRLQMECEGSDMNKLKRASILILLVIIGFVLIDCSMQKVAERHEGYTEANLWAYYLYTDSDIRHAPRASEKYHFTFTAEDGTQPRDSSIVYGPGADITVIRNYLTSLGYASVKREGLLESWQRKGENTPYFVITRDPQTRTLTLTRSSF